MGNEPLTWTLVSSGGSVLSFRTFLWSPGSKETLNHSPQGPSLPQGSGCYPWGSIFGGDQVNWLLLNHHCAQAPPHLSHSSQVSCSTSKLSLP